ncbi:MAG: UDP-N-acetylmuramoyl-L-alanine--D-glutamate ligase [Gemmatimonadales bacterium]|nr:MAG: UDP-N-acetylmuramoyl-L-alanine--D-glutamate ligase [Gemmatimonadales bacterium]
MAGDHRGRAVLDPGHPRRPPGLQHPQDPMSPPRRVAVVGIGASGVAAARLALSRGDDCHVSDLRTDARAQTAARGLRALGADVDLGRHDLDRILHAQRVVVSPGIPPGAPVHLALADAGVPWVSEPQFALEFHPGPLIAVTGTNGKTTTVLLLAHLLRSAGIRATAAGNTGGGLAPAASDAVREADGDPRTLVLELSSFQLAGHGHVAPQVGVVTSLAPDHLDRYPSVEAYWADKARLFQAATPDSRWVLAADPNVEVLAGDAPGHRYRFHDRGPGGEAEGGDEALGSSHGHPVHAWVEGPRGGEAALVLATEGPGSPEVLVPTDELGLLGRHNWKNALAASLAARVHGAPLEGIRQGLRTFEPLPHRMEPVAREGGVLWVNDSKATNAAAARAALESVDGPVVLLLGGSDKGEDLSGLLDDLPPGRVRAVVCQGDAGPRILHGLRERSPEGVELVGEAGGFGSAVRRARSLARPGDLLLLSPACASFDAFENYEARGRRFAELAREARS